MKHLLKAAAFIILLSAETSFAANTFGKCVQLEFIHEMDKKVSDKDYKILTFLRHGKATDRDKFTSAERQADPSLVPLDKGRELAPKGRKAVAKAGKLLSKLSFSKKNVVMFASSAVRTVETATIVSKELNSRSKTIIAEDALYYADVGKELYSRLGKPEFEDTRHAFFVGHGKSTNAFVSSMTGADQGIFNPTAGVLVVAVKAKTWKEVFEGNHEKVYLFGWSPKETQTINAPRVLELTDSGSDEGELTDHLDPDEGSYYHGTLNQLDWLAYVSE